VGPLLGNDHEITGSHGNESSRNNTGDVWNGAFYAVRARVLYNEDTSRAVVSCKGVWRENLFSGDPAGNEVSAEAEESHLLEAVIRERLMKTQQTENLACAVAICKVWRSAMALYLSVVASRVLKWSINPIFNQNPVYSHTPTHDNIFVLATKEQRQFYLKACIVICM
jgi:hypothetical protein